VSYINRVTVNKAQRSPGHWQIKTNIATIDDRSGRRLARLQRYKTFLGTEAQAEMERYRTLWDARGRPELTSSAPAPEADETVGSYAAKWLQAREADRKEIEAAETERTRRNRVYLYVVPAWGHLRLSTLRRGEILAGAQWLGCQLSAQTGARLTPTTVKHAVLTLQAIVEAAAERGGASLLACDFEGVKRSLLAQDW
jgi:hypothetical protein